MSEVNKELIVEDFFNDTKWGVHVLGPDNVLAASSFEEANQKAFEINQALLAFTKNPRYEDVKGVGCFAQVAIWGQIANFEHNPSETDWDNSCS